jgi:hypothetical protein
LSHADLAGTVDAFNGFGGPSCQDDQGHGTHVTGDHRGAGQQC